MFVCTSIEAQTSAPSLDCIPVRAVAPEAASLGKFGNNHVDYCTGVPSVSIPVTTIKIGKINLPISLNYHASWIKVDEISSCVGIGWALNGNGMISRNVIGLPDETPIMVLSPLLMPSWYQWQEVGAQPTHIRVVCC